MAELDGEVRPGHPTSQPTAVEKDLVPKERSDQRAVREAIEGWEEDSRTYDSHTEYALRENPELVQSSVDVWGFTKEKILRRLLNLMEVDVMAST